MQNIKKNEHLVLLAPIWHTCLTALVLVGLPLIGASKFMHSTQYLHDFFIQNKELLYFFGLLAEWGGAGLVYLGLYINKIPLSIIIGVSTLEERAYDIALSIGAFLLIIFSTATFTMIFHPVRTNSIDIYPKTAVQFYFLFLLLVSGGITEELIFRGYFLQQFTFLFKSGFSAVILQASLFSLSHGFHEGIGDACNKFIMGVILGCVAYKRKSLASPIITHCALNALGAIAIMLNVH